jgi:exopolysaccharide production protein ExoQ
MRINMTMSENVDLARPTARGVAAAVGFFFSFRVMIMLLSVRLLGVEPATGSALSVAINLALFAVVFFYSVGNRNHSIGDMLKLPSLRWVMAFVVFSGCSLAWSSTASMAAAVAFWCGMVADVGIVLLLLRADPAEEVAISLMKGFVYGACVVALVAWVLPAQTDMRLGDEELLGPNQIGFPCAFAIFLAQYLMSRKQGKWAPAVGLLSVTLLRSLSKTTIVAFLVGEAFILLKDNSIRRKTKVLLALQAAIVVVIFSSLLTSYFGVYASGSDPESLTGRIGIWAVIVEAALEHPWIGHGFHSVWKVIPPFGVFEARHAHNELLQQFYAYGVAGIGLIVGLYGSFYKQVRRLAPSSFRTIFLGFLLFILVRGLADTEPFDLSFPLWMIGLLSVLVNEFRAKSDAVMPLMPDESNAAWPKPLPI